MGGHMSGILSKVRKETQAKSITDADPESFVRILKVPMEENESEGAQNGKIVRAFLLVDIGQAIKYLFGSGGTTSEVAERTVEKVLDTETDEATTSARVNQKSQGRGVLSKLLLVGVVVGLGYLLKSRSESTGEVVSKTTDRARSLADETARRSGEVAQRTEAVTGQVAERIQEKGETAADQVETGTKEAADQVEEGGEMAADQVQEGSQKAADQIEEAAETAESTQEQSEEADEEMSNEDDQSEEKE